MMGVLMQLRKVCNHPDLFEERLIRTSLIVPPLQIHMPKNIFVEDMSCEFGPMLRRCELLPLREIRSKYDSNIAKTPAERVILDMWKNRFEQDQSIVEFDESDDIDNPVLKRNQLLLISRQKEKSRRRREVVSENKRRVESLAPVYGHALRHLVRVEMRSSLISSSSLVRSYAQRLKTMDQTIKKWMLLVPPARSRPAKLCAASHALPSNVEMRPSDSEKLKHLFARPARKKLHTWCSRNEILFPDRWLVQYDCGKLQVLARLLHKLKRGGHKVLIFTQMTKMLDVMEVFLNLHSHTYVRLDGSTKVEDRAQRAQRFNNDPKIFCFLLTTRSGGLGLNLIGADTVVFLDQDWNPSIDAQAQDRAHRIGQTRDVHIYRLITKQTIEENILLKASQKRDLSRLSIEDGLFTTMNVLSNNAKDEDDKTKKKTSYLASVIQGDGGGVKQDEIRAAMATVEDTEDAVAATKMRSEMEAQGIDFSSSSSNSKEVDVEESKLRDKEAEETEKRKWISSSDQALRDMENSLPPVHRFALTYRTEIDRPESQLTALSPDALAKAMAARQSLEIEAALSEQSEIEAMLCEPEGRMELDAAALVDPKRDARLTSSQRRAIFLRCTSTYFERKKRMKKERRQRRLQGLSWSPYIDEKSGRLFYYNLDTGKSQWDKPDVLVARDAIRDASKEGYSALPLNILLNILSVLEPYPDNFNMFLCCKKWERARNHRSLEILVNQTGTTSYVSNDSMRAVERFVPRVFTSLSAAVACASAGRFFMFVFLCLCVCVCVCVSFQTYEPSSQTQVRQFEFKKEHIMNLQCASRNLFEYLLVPQVALSIYEVR